MQQEQIRHLESMTYAWSYHLLISRHIDDGPYFIDAFNRGLAILRENGEFERIMGSYITPRTLD
ncbi:MAG: hypothetical protein JJ866_16940 [Roseibium sp.]|uniref:hypothetical protein n=1 Tax=Roseibium sp. TaxID=1936156 RepID=UPI001B1DB5BB|nr:hypothetical protein [Roseibium sp.]MBO6893631.1 hypothetical protein [Roseibium sp.]MBO6928126.1 hypothetical protein [Roseibium sp.]